MDYKIDCYFFLLFLLLLYLFICVYIFWATSTPPSSLTSRQSLFCPLVLQSCWTEILRDNKKDIAFLLDGERDSYTERFLALLPCTCVLQTTLVHIYQTSSLLPGDLPKAAAASLRLLFCSPTVGTSATFKF
jgi:hypothetical protein